MYVIDGPKELTNNRAASNITLFVNNALIGDVITSIIAKLLLSTEHRPNTPSLT